MKKLPVFALGLLLLAGGATLGHAQQIEDAGQHSPKRVVELLRDHERRIEDGEKSGELTHHEARDLRAKEDYYRAKMDDFLHRNHGYLTDNEEHSLMDSLGALSGQIHRAKHNDAVR